MSLNSESVCRGIYLNAHIRNIERDVGITTDHGFMFFEKKEQKDLFFLKFSVVQFLCFIFLFAKNPKYGQFNSVVHFDCLIFVLQFVCLVV